MNPLVIILGLVGGIVILINPFAGLLAVVALIPQALIPAVGNTLFGVFTMATPIKIIGGFTFISVFIKHIGEKKNWDFLKKPQIKFFVLFLIWIFISGFTQPGEQTRENFTLFTSFAMLGFSILLLVDTAKRFRWVMWAGLISIFIVALNAVFNSLGHEEAIRISGASYGPNYFAIGLIPFLGLAFYNIFTEENKIFKILSFIITVVVAIALMVTFSRGGLVGFLGMLAIAAIKAKKKIRAFLFLAFCFMLLVNFLPQGALERLEQTEYKSTMVQIGNPIIDSTTRRVFLAKAAWKMFLAHPLFGVGVGNYYWECGKYEAVHAGRAHTMFLEIMAELGVIGIFLFLGMLFHVFKSLKKIMNSDSGISGYAWGLYIGLVGFLIAALFLHAQQEKVLWFVIFMAVALENIWERERAKDKVKRVRRVQRVGEFKDGRERIR